MPILGSRLVLGSAIALAVALVIAAAATSWAPPLAGERERIRRHLAAVERALRAADVTSLTPAQRQARLGHLDRLRAYRERGRFPHNHDLPGRTPVFVDRHGTRCAVAHLIESSGGGRLVARVAATRNHARVAELAGDPELRAWLAEAGLTVAEAGRIQPAYDGVRVATLSNGAPIYCVAAAVTDVAQLLAIGFNLRTDRPWPIRRTRAVVGLLGGVAGMAMGAGGFAVQDRRADALGGATLALGTVAVALSLRNLNTHPAEEPSVRDGGGTPGPALGLRARPGEPLQLAVRVAF